MAWKLPPSMGFDEGATLGVGILTVGQGFQDLKLDLLTDDVVLREDEFVLVYGGWTASGALGIQFVKL